MDNKIKVLHIIKSLGRGGAEMLLPETLKLHDRKKFSFHYIYFLPWKNQMVEALESEGARVSCFEATNNLQILFKSSEIINYIQKHNIQLVHAHLPWAGFLARLIHKKIKIPLIYTEHNKQERYHKLTYWLNKLTFNAQSKVLAVSGDVESSIKKRINPKIKIQLLLNGVNTSYFVRKNLHELENDIKRLSLVNVSNTFKSNNNKQINLEFDNGKHVLEKLLNEKKANHELLVVGNVAVFRFQKRLIEWIKVFHEASKENLNLKGVIVGNGSFAEELLKLRDELDLKEKLFLPGLQINTKDWYSIMDIFMMTSEFEGLPIALLEAMSMECAIVTTDAGGIKEVIQDGKSGLMVGVDEWEKLSEKLMMLKNGELRMNLASKARERVKCNFSLARMVAELEKEYEQLTSF